MQNLMSCAAIDFYGNIVDNFVRVSNCGHSSVSVGHVYGHTKCTLLPCKGKYCTLSVENKEQCSTLSDSMIVLFK